MSIAYTKNNRIVLKNAKSMMVIPYVYDNDVEEYVLGDTIYDIFSIIKDSIVIEQADGEATVKTNEFNGRVIVNNVTMGETKFTAQCLDLQDKVLRSLFGAAYGINESVDPPVEVRGLAAMPDEYKTLYALIRIRFKESSIPDVYLPKVQMNSKLLLHQMGNVGSQGTLGGTVLPTTICVDTGTDERTENSLVNFVLGDGTTSYAVDTPVLFCPQGMTPYFLHHYDGSRYTFSQVKWNVQDGSSVSTVTVDEADMSHISS